MKKYDAIRIRHIKDAIRLIEKFTKNVSVEEFIKNEMLNSAVIRQFEIIGEAVANLSDAFKLKNSNIDWKTIRKFRNVLIHEYFRVDLPTVWNSVQRVIPQLKEWIFNSKL